MRKLQNILFIQILILTGCNNGIKNDVVTNNEHVFEQVSNIQDTHVAIPDSIAIKEWATDGNDILISTNNPNCMFALLSLDSVSVSNTFGKKGKGEGEFLMPHVLGSKASGFMIIDNGNKKILRVNGTDVTEVNGTGDTDIFNQPHFIGNGLIGYEELTPTQLKLNKYDFDNLEKSTILTFPEDGITDNSDLYDFVWDFNDDNLVIAHLYTDKFSIRNYETDGSISSVNNVIGDDNYNQNRIMYSDIACGDYIYLLYQGNVDIEKYSGFSIIEKYDYNGNPISNYVYDGIIEKIILDQDRNRMLFTSTSDEDLHYFKL